MRNTVITALDVVLIVTQLYVVTRWPWPPDWGWNAIPIGGMILLGWVASYDLGSRYRAWASKRSAR